MKDPNVNKCLTSPMALMRAVSNARAVCSSDHRPETPIRAVSGYLGPDYYLRVAQIVGPSGFLKISKAKLYELVKEGRIPAPYHPTPGISLWKTADLIAFVENSVNTEAANE